MKYGEQFEQESVPQWSLHNIDYNSLKHHIKVHTTKDQAAAITIPGQPNSVLTRFEEDLYQELCRQHDRVNLFVTSKADEIARRLHHLSNQVHRLIVRCATSGRDRVSIKRQQRFAKYEEMLLQCGDDIKSLQRFVNAQNVAFRKILKKYRKWTGSSTLGTRFRDDVLSSLKSFTKLDFSRLQSQYNDLFETLHAALPEGTDGRITLKPPQQPPRPSSSQLSPNATIVAQEPQPAGYWNEYDHGSEAGDDHHTDDYAIYIDPNADSFPAFTTLAGFLTTPLHKLTTWISHPSNNPPPPPTPNAAPSSPNITNNHPHNSTLTRSPISSPYYLSTPPNELTTPTNTTPSPPPPPAHCLDNRLLPILFPVLQPPTPRQPLRWQRVFHLSPGVRNVLPPFSSSSRTHQGYAQCQGSGYGYGYGYGYGHDHDHGHNQQQHMEAMQQMQRDKLRLLRWSAVSCFAAAYLLMGLAGVLIYTGRHRMRMEVDAGVAGAVVGSLGVACGGLCLFLAVGGEEDNTGGGMGMGEGGGGWL